MIHSTRVEEAIATRSSARTPSAIRPAATFLTRTAVCAQVSERHCSAPGVLSAACSSTGTGNLYASSPGVASTLLRKRCATEAGRPAVLSEPITDCAELERDLRGTRWPRADIGRR